MIDNVPRPPRGRLSKDARQWWTRIVSQWELETASLLILESALEAYDRMHQAADEVNREGVTIKDQNGIPRKHPAVSVEAEQRGLMLRFFKALGIDLEAVGEMGRPPGT